MKVYYDEQFDTLEVFFEDPEMALTVELRDDVYVHIVPGSRQVIGLTIHHFREQHNEVALPFRGTLNPITPQVAWAIEEALSPT